MPWYIYALLSTLFFAAQDLLMRVLAVKAISLEYFLSCLICGARFCYSCIYYSGGSFHDLKNLTPINIILIICAVVLYGFYERTHFSARKEVDASSFSIIFRLTTVIAFIGSILFLHEFITLNKFIGGSLIIGASFLLLYKNIKLKISRSFGWLYLALCYLVSY